jgi:hypothetical protein
MQDKCNSRFFTKKGAALIAALLAAWFGLALGTREIQVHNFDTIEQMVEQGSPNANRIIYVAGYWSANDGGGGMFVSVASASSTNAGTRIYSHGQIFERILPGNFVSPRMFGAKGDLSDDTAAIQATIDYATSKGLRMRWDNGNYYHGPVIVAGNSVDIDFRNAVLKAKDSITADWWKFTNVARVNIRGGIIDGNKANQPANAANWRSSFLWLGNTTNFADVTIRDTVFTNSVCAGFRTIGTPNGNTTLENCEFRNGAEHGGVLGLQTMGLSFSSSIANARPVLNVVNCKFIQDAAPNVAGAAPGGIIVAGADATDTLISCSIKDNYFQQCGQNMAVGNFIGCVDMYEDTFNNTITGNRVKDGHYVAFKVQNCSRSVIANNVVDGVASDGLVGIWYDPHQRSDVTQTNEVSIIEGNIIKNRTSGITIAGNVGLGRSCLVRGNWIEDVSSRGIDVGGVGAGVGFEGPLTIEGNRINRAVTGVNFVLCSKEMTLQNNMITATEGVAATSGDNTGLNLTLRGNYINATGGGAYAVRVLGVNKLLMESGSYTNSGGGPTILVQKDGSNNKIGEMYFPEANRVTGSVVITNVLTWRGDVNILAFGADQTGTADSGGAITAAINAVVDAANPTKIVFPPNGIYKTTGTIALNPNTTISAYGAKLLKNNSAATVLKVDSGCKVYGLEIQGTGNSSYDDLGRGIGIVGTVGTYKSGILIEDCYIHGISGYGIRADFAERVRVVGGRIEDVGYAGVMGLSVTDMAVNGTHVKNVTPGTGGNGYGISFTRQSSDTSLAVFPRSKDCKAVNVTVDGVTFWEGIDAHAASGALIEGSTVKNCKIGIALVSSALVAGTDGYAPLNCRVIGNHIEGLGTGYGIVLSGAAGTLGAPVEYAQECVISGNTLKNCGEAANNLTGAIYLENSEGSVVSGNTFQNSRCNAINFNSDNKGFSFTGNTVVDVWDNTYTAPTAVAMRSSFNYGTISGNTFLRKDTTLGTFVSDRGINVSVPADCALSIGPNRNTFTTAMIGARGQNYSYAQMGDNVQTFTGLGTPEGAITASPGSLFHRTDGGAGTTLYVKESGTGNTGWIGQSSQGYMITFIGGGAANSPADSTTYYWGTDTESALHSAYANVSIKVPKSGKITGAYINVIKNVNASNENVALNIRINDTTDLSLGNMTWTATDDKLTVTGLSQAVTAGDVVAVKMVTPAWVTNPTGCRLYGYIYIE